jgi:hypothetical protein
MGTTLNANQTMYANFYLLSQNGLYKAILQSNGDFVVMVKILFFTFFV